MKFDLRPCPLRLRSSLFCGGACSSWTSLTRLLRMPAVVCLRQGGRCPCCAVQWSSAGTVSEPLRGLSRYIDDARIACLRAVHVTALPYFTRLPVSCLSQQTREQARAVTEFSVLLAVFWGLAIFQIFGFSLPVRVCRREWDLSHPACARCSGFSSSQSSEPPCCASETLHLQCHYSEDRRVPTDPVLGLLDDIRCCSTTGAWS